MRDGAGQIRGYGRVLHTPHTPSSIFQPLSILIRDLTKYLSQRNYKIYIYHYIIVSDKLKLNASTIQTLLPKSLHLLKS
jgi:hypothetical protein